MRILQCDNGLEVVVFDEGDTIAGNKKFKDELRERIDWLYSAYRDRVCLVCGEHFGVFDLHHSIVTKKDVQGWQPKSKRKIVDVELNFIPLHNWCHISNPPTKDRSWKHQCKFYGEEIMSEWYYSLPFKVLPRRF